MVSKCLKERDLAWWKQLQVSRQNKSNEKIRDWKKMKKKLNEQFLPFLYLKTPYNDLHDLKQARRSLSNSREQYQTNSKFGQAFQTYSNTSSLTSVGKSGSIETRVQNGRDNLVIPVQNQLSFATLEARDPFKNEGFKGLKCGKVGHELED